MFELSLDLYRSPSSTGLDNPKLLGNMALHELKAYINMRAQTLIRMMIQNGN